MPELPEVETMVRGIRPFVEGRVLREVVACPCACRPITLDPTIKAIQRTVAGRTVSAVRRRAKRIVMELDSGAAFVIEPRMTGLMLLSDPPNTTHLRLEWRFAPAPGVTEAAGNSIWFWDQRGLGTVRLYNPEQLAMALSSDRIGPDALEMTAADWKRVCGSTDRAIKVVLLDQKQVGGIGNLYASEILHLSRIHPERKASSLTTRERTRMASAVLAVLEEAILYEGSTLSDGTYRNALNESGSYQNAHKVYDREGRECFTCGGQTIQRIVQAQRSTFFCVKCQKAPRE